MSVDTATVKHIAHLARIAIDEEDGPRLAGELSNILGWIEQLNGIDTMGVEPMTSVQPLALRRRADVIDDGNFSDKIVANAPASEDAFFLVPKVVE